MPARDNGGAAGRSVAWRPAFAAPAIPPSRSISTIVSERRISMMTLDTSYVERGGSHGQARGQGVVPEAEQAFPGQRAQEKFDALGGRSCGGAVQPGSRFDPRSGCRTTAS